MLQKVKQMLIWGGYTTHIYSLACEMARKGYDVTVTTDSQSGLRPERVPQYVDKSVKFLECKTDEDAIRICKAFDKESTLHINGAIKNEARPIHAAFRHLLKNGYHVISLPQEGFQLQGLRGKLNYLKWVMYMHCTYRRHMMAYGLTGLNAQRQFRQVGVPQEKLFQFIYVTQPPVRLSPIPENKSLRLLYVGAIDERKNIIPLVRHLQQHYADRDYTMDIYGSWSLDAELSALVEGDRHIAYHGKQPLAEVKAAMQHADLLFLPSLYDGWGAVVSEALQCGCRVAVSRQSGSNILARLHPAYGDVFDACRLSTLDPILERTFRKGPQSAAEREGIIDWAERSLAPGIVADYLEAVLAHYFEGAALPQAPWA